MTQGNKDKNKRIFGKENISNPKRPVANAQKYVFHYILSHFLSEYTSNIAIKIKMNIGIPEKVDFKKWECFKKVDFGKHFPPFHWL